MEDVIAQIDNRVDLRGNHYSQSHYEYSEIVEAVKRFQEPHRESIRYNPHYRLAMKRMLEWARSRDLRMHHFTSDDDIREALPKVDTHSGWLYILTGFRTKGENLDGLFNDVMKLIGAARKAGSFNLPILPGHRTQGNPGITDDGVVTDHFKLKTRLVSMVDLRMIVVELMYSIDVQEVFGNWVGYAGGKSTREQSAIVTDMRSNFDTFCVLDYSSYDQSLPSWLIEDAFLIIREMFRNDSKFDQELWDIMVHDFIHKTFVLADGYYECNDGVPSGSMWTSIIDSLCNHIMINTVMSVIGVTSFRSFVMGDDNYIGCLGSVDWNRVFELITYLFGVHVNADKSAVYSRGDDPEFLSRYWSREGTCWRHPAVLIAKMLYPERFRNYAGHPESPPDMVLWAYILEYLGGMRELVDIERFKRDHIYTRDDLLKAVPGTLPGYLEYRRRYGGQVVAT